MLDAKQGQVLPLVSEDQGRLYLQTATLQHITRFQGPYCFLSICGDYRSGKSFLLNSLFFDFQGFQTSGTTQACTKGINVWSQPIEKQGMLVWLLDTEGFGSIEQDSSYDGKIFLLSLLLSNVMLYNSFGAIDENSIAKLGLVCSQAHLINPKFADVQLFWILRDFSLEMVDRNGKGLSADEYLEQCLKEENSHNRAQKQLLKRLFKVRHCVPLIRPVIDQTTLSNLRGVKRQQLRWQFKQQIKTLAEHVSHYFQKKEVGGIQLSHQNVSVVIKEFVTVLNSGKIDVQLTSSYERIKHYQQARLKETIADRINDKLSSLRRLLPVKQEHIRYVESEIKQIVIEQLQKSKIHFSQQHCQSTAASMITSATTQLQKIEIANRNQAQSLIKDHLYRQMIELYPVLISLSLQNFEAQLEEHLNNIKIKCFQHYHFYFRDIKELQIIFSIFIEKQFRKIVYQLTKRWRTGYRDLEQRLEEARRFRSLTDEELSKIKQEKRKVHQKLEEYRREEGRSLSKLKLQMEETYKEQLTVVVTQYEVKLKAAEESREREVIELKNRCEQLRKSNIELSTSIQYEKQSLLQKIALQHEKAELIQIKYQQLKSSSSLQMEQLKSSYQSKLGIMEIRYNEITSTLSNERKKFQLLNEERKIEEAQIMEELNDKNEKIERLTTELLELEQKYKIELQTILNEEKDILVKTISHKIQDYEHKCQMYQSQIEEAHSTIRDLEFYQQKCDELEVQARQMKRAQEQAIDKIQWLNNQLKKQETDIQEKQRNLLTLKQNYEKQCKIAQETIANNANFLKDAEARHRQQIQYYQRKIEIELAQKSESLAEAHESNLRQNKVLLQQKFAKQRAQLKQIISNNYEQIERLKLKITALHYEIDSIHAILRSIRNSNQIFGNGQSSIPSNSHKKRLSFDHQQDLVQISESPQEESQPQMSDKKQKIDSIRFLAEEVREIFYCMREELQLHQIQRLQLKARVEQHEQLMNTRLQAAGRQAGKESAIEIQRLRNKVTLLDTIAQDYKLTQNKLQILQRDNFQLRKDAEIKEQAYQSRTEHYIQSNRIHKETITNLTEQNQIMAQQIRNLTQKLTQVQGELERFKLWAQVQSKSERQWSSTHSEGVRADESASKIKDLEKELKRLIDKVQEERMAEVEKQSKRQKGLSSLMSQHCLEELSQLRKENQILYKQLQECHQKQIQMRADAKLQKQQYSQYEESRYMSLAEELETVKQNARQTINRLQAEIHNHIQEKRQLQNQFNDLEANITKKYELNQMLMQQELQSLKKDKETLTEVYSKKVAVLQESINSRVNQAERKLAETQLRYEQEQEARQSQWGRVSLEAERHRMKYEQLLKVNQELLKEIQNLKSKAHQTTIKEKYRDKISKLFTD